MKLFCDQNMISGHLKKKHEIATLMEYNQIRKYEGKSRRKEVKEGFGTFYSECAQKHCVSQRVRNFCKFKCPKCEYVCQSWRSMTSHVTQSGHGPPVPPFKCITKVMFYKCKLCDEIMLCDSNFLTNHLRKHHFTILAYNNQNNSVPFQNCADLETQFLSQLKAVTTHIPAVEPKPKQIVNPKSLPNHQVTKDVGNICLFKCPFCSKKNTSFKNMYHHFKNKTQLSEFYVQA